MIVDDIWNDLFGGMDGFEKRIRDMMSDKGSGVRTYGYTMYRGPDGIPHVREYGNCGSMLQSGDALPSARRPFHDIVVEGDSVKAVFEIPGTSKEDIDLRCTGHTLTVDIKTPGKEFVQEYPLPREVDPDSATAEYNNGILEVSLSVKNKEGEGVRIPLN